MTALITLTASAVSPIPMVAVVSGHQHFSDFFHISSLSQSDLLSPLEKLFFVPLVTCTVLPLHTT
jgi:hypothetical protein